MRPNSAFSLNNKIEARNSDDFEFERLLQIASANQARETRRRKAPAQKPSLNRRTSQSLPKVFLVGGACLS